MDVLLVGKGGREAALAFRIARSPSLGTLHVLGVNPSWPEGAVVHDERALDGIVALASALRVGLVVVGPEAPLAAGLVDRLEAVGIPGFGPRAEAARLEASKAFAKEIMAAAGVPTAGALLVDKSDPDSLARARERCARGQVVVKADGLAAGKGVIVCPGAAEALAALDEVLERFGAASDRLLLEDLMVGPEVSVFGLCDGERVVPLLTAQDHKRLRDGDEGPNTGGMGAFGPSPLVDDATLAQWVEDIHAPVVAEMARRGTPFRGVLYAGLMLTDAGPRVLEFNVRFGDPECQVLMSLWSDDVLRWLHGAAVGALPPGRPAFQGGAACCVVLASAGYPLTSQKGVPIPTPAPSPGVEAFAAGVGVDASGTLVTDGGRVLGITGTGETLAHARDLAYAALEGWRFEGAQWRTDIAAGK